MSLLDYVLKKRQMEKQQNAANIMAPIVESYNQGLMNQPIQDQRTPEGYNVSLPKADFVDRAGLMSAFQENAPNLDPTNTKLVQGLLGNQTRKPTTLMQNIEAAGYAKGSPEYQQAVKDYLSKAQTQINMNMQKPLGASAANWRNKQGQAAPPIMSMDEAYGAGYTPRTTTEIKTTETTQQASAPLGQMIKYGFGGKGEKSLFPEDSTGLMDRARGGAEAWLQGITESNNRISLYNSNKSALVTGLARLVGQVGTLTEKDVQTVESLFPTAGLTPNSLAKEKFKGIVTLLMGKGVPEKQLKLMGFPQWSFKKSKTPPPPEGFK